MSQGVPSGFPGDEPNPYAPPVSDVGPDAVLAGLTPMSFTIGDVLTRTWEIYKDRLGLCLGVFWGCWAINVVSQLALQIVQAGVSMGAGDSGKILVALIALGGTLGLLVLQILIGIGQAMLLLGIARGQDVVFGDVFSGGRYVLRVILATMLVMLIVMGIVMLSAIPGGVIWALLGSNSPGGPIALGVGILAGLVVAVVLGLRFGQFYYLIIDRDAATLESLRASLQITRGQLGTIIVILLVAMAANVAGALACFVGLVFTVPYTTLLFAVMYLALTGQPTADPYAKGRPMVDLEPL